MQVVALCKSPAANEALAQAFAGHELRIVAAREELLADAAAPQVWVLSNMGFPRHYVDRATLAAAPGLRFIQQLGVTADIVDVRAAADLGIPVAVNDAVNSVAVAEQAVYLLMASAKRAREADLARDRRQVGFPATTELSGKCACIVGFGRVGSAAAVRLRAFGMRIIAVDPAPNIALAQAIAVDELLEPPALPDALGRADFVLLTLPLSDASVGIIGPRELAAMKPGARLINTSRGPLVDEAALRAAIREGRLAGYATDVWWREPIDPDDELLRNPTVIVTPHIGGTPAETVVRAAQYARANVARVARGEPPLRVVNGVARARGG